MPWSAGCPFLLRGGSTANWSELIYHSVTHGFIHALVSNLVNTGWRKTMEALEKIKPHLRSARDFLGEFALSAEASAVTAKETASAGC
jgi:hypothetical protein